MSEKNILTRVGLFMLLGLALAGALIVYFGRLGEGMRHYYKINVTYPNASGLKKGADVLLSGARIGRVAAPPAILPNMQGVTVPLMIYDKVKIPKKSRFTIGSSGLLGDRFIDIIVDKEAAKTPPLASGSTVEGEREAAIGDIIATVNRVAEQASTLMSHLDVAVQDVGAIAKKVQKDLLQPDTLQNLSVTLSNLKHISENFAHASHRLDGIMASASSALGGGKKTFSSVDSAAEEVRKTASDLRSMLQTSKQGQGALGLLLNNTETAANLSAFIANLRKYGILWYKNRTPTTTTIAYP